MDNISNSAGPLADLMRNAKTIGKEIAAGQDAMPKLALLVAKGADTGIINLEKDGDGRDDAQKIYEAVVMEQSKKAVHEHTDSGKKANVSKLRQIIKMVCEQGSKYDGIKTLDDALRVRKEKQAADAKGVKPCYAALVDVAREQVKMDRQMSDDELGSIVSKAPAADPDLEKKLTTVKNSLEKIITGEAGVKTDDERVIQAHNLIDQAVAALVTMRETKATLEKAAALGMTLVQPGAPEVEEVDPALVDYTAENLAHAGV